MCGYVHVKVCHQGSGKKASDILELEIPGSVSCPMWCWELDHQCQSTVYLENTHSQPLHILCRPVVSYSWGILLMWWSRTATYKSPKGNREHTKPAHSTSWCWNRIRRPWIQSQLVVSSHIWQKYISGTPQMCRSMHHHLSTGALHRRSYLVHSWHLSPLIQQQLHHFNISHLGGL